MAERVLAMEGVQYFETVQAQRNYLFTLEISEGPACLAGTPVPDTKFILATAQTPTYETETKDILDAGRVIPMPLKDSSPREMTTKMRYVSNSQAYNYLIAWKRAVSDPKTGLMVNNSMLGGTLVFRSFDPSGNHIVKEVIYYKAFPVRIAGGDYDRGGSDFIEQDITWKFIAWEEKEFDLPTLQDQVFDVQPTVNPTIPS